MDARKDGDIDARWNSGRPHEQPAGAVSNRSATQCLGRAFLSCLHQLTPIRRRQLFQGPPQRPANPGRAEIKPAGKLSFDGHQQARAFGLNAVITVVGFAFLQGSRVSRAPLDRGQPRLIPAATLHTRPDDAQDILGRREINRLKTEERSGPRLQPLRMFSQDLRDFSKSGIGLDTAEFHALG